MTITTQKYIRKLNKMSRAFKKSSRDCLYEINNYVLLIKWILNIKVKKFKISQIVYN